MHLCWLDFGFVKARNECTIIANFLRSGPKLAATMAIRKIEIPRRHSLLLYAALAIAMVFASYLLTLTLAIAFVCLPLLAVYEAPNLQTLLLLVGGIVVAAAMLWSLIPRREKRVIPGPVLDPSAHPRLFAEIEKIARSLDEPVPSEVYLLSESNAWVADFGGWMGIGSRRVMGLGFPLLASLSVSQFRAILTHEFAHYYGGDTNLGPWVFRAQRAMARSIRNMHSIGRHRWPGAITLLLIAAVSILNWYWLLFLRGINFVSRRQEYRADELACILNGRQSFASGLKAVRVAIWFWPIYWSDEVAPMLKQGCLPPIGTGFSQFLAGPQVAQRTWIALNAEIRDGQVNIYSSHPHLRDRLNALASLATLNQPETKEAALTLLNDVEAQELRLLEHANAGSAIPSLQRVSWQEQGNVVLVPFWRATVTAYSHLLNHATPAKIPDALARVPEVAPYIRDPEGMLLTPGQRCERARFLLASGFALALVENGWTVNSAPGSFLLSRGKDQLDPFDIIRQLSAGEMKTEMWAAKCKALEIENLPFAITPPDAAGGTAAAGA